ncbi:hypothetical protein [Amycolatopsis australiensis]|uniref:hypothetical protein n=1 Tax=Amycolatopsis australiensis TaxID=546364 RepID=UPI0011610F2C|nr:hypothetical protein [Amycolatopsis australiensis]
MTRTTAHGQDRITEEAADAAIEQVWPVPFIECEGRELRCGGGVQGPLPARRRTGQRARRGSRGFASLNAAALGPERRGYLRTPMAAPIRFPRRTRLYG